MGCFASGLLLLSISLMGSVAYEITSNAFISIVLALFSAWLFFKFHDDLFGRKAKHLVFIKDVDEMSGVEFEEFLVTLFQDTGHRAWKTGKSGDFGIDVLVQIEGRLIAIQAKRYKSNVGVKALYEAIAGEAYYKADEAWVVTNSNFTPQARTYAQKTNRVKLIDRGGLSLLIKDRNKVVQKKIAEDERRKLRN